MSKSFFDGEYCDEAVESHFGSLKKKKRRTSGGGPAFAETGQLQESRPLCAWKNGKGGNVLHRLHVGQGVTGARGYRSRKGQPLARNAFQLCLSSNAIQRQCRDMCTRSPSVDILIQKLGCPLSHGPESELGVMISKGLEQT